MTLQEWIDNKISEVATRLPTLVHTEPASFSCGFNTGYKQAMLDLDRFLEDKNESSMGMPKMQTDKCPI